VQSNTGLEKITREAYPTVAAWLVQEEDRLNKKYEGRKRDIHTEI
jgi:hypothetical protein